MDYLGASRWLSRRGPARPTTRMLGRGLRRPSRTSSDAICARRLGLIHRGDEHRAASGLLATATPDGAKLSQVFRRLIDIKDEAHYGLTLVSSRKARDAVRWAQTLVSRAAEELER